MSHEPKDIMLCLLNFQKNLLSDEHNIISIALLEVFLNADRILIIWNCRSD